MIGYRDVLTPEQAVEMGRFLRALSNAGRECKRVGIKPDVGVAIKAWSGREGGKKING